MKFWPHMPTRSTCWAPVRAVTIKQRGDAPLLVVPDLNDQQGLLHEYPPISSGVCCSAAPRTEGRSYPGLAGGVEGAGLCGSLKLLIQIKVPSVSLGFI